MIRLIFPNIAKLPHHYYSPFKCIASKQSLLSRCNLYMLQSKAKISRPLSTGRPLLSSTGNDLSYFNCESSDRKQRHYSHFHQSFSCLCLLTALSYFFYKKAFILYAKELPSPEGDTHSASGSEGAAALPADIEPGLEIAGLPFYSREQVAQHSDPNNAELGVWISYKAGVYDVTSFVKVHPGGDNILLGAGNSIEPFWEVYGQHKTQQVFQLLESFRIGNLCEADRLKPGEVQQAGMAEFIPERNAALTVHHQTPFNAETPAELLIQNWQTPNQDFFIRHHLAVPEVDPAEYQLEVEGLTLPEPRSFSLEELKSLFAKHTVTSVIQCAGNRRDAFNEIKEVKGISWGVGAIGNAQWSGAKLVDVLRHCGANLEDKSIRHVQFEGLDLDATSTPYGASVPADKALNPFNEFIIAYEMNGQPIPIDHGFPVRLIAPGIVGARNVKWLGKIVLSEEESHSHWQRNDYKSFPSSQESATAEEFAAATAIQELPVQSAICMPVNGQKVTVQWKPLGGHLKPVIEVAGYAWSGGGRAIIRVDLSIDGGRTWHVAELTQEEPQRPLHHTYSWTTWKADLPLEGGQLYHGKQYDILCRAFDASYNSQPKEAAEIWNFRGLLNNSWHRVSVQL